MGDWLVDMSASTPRLSCTGLAENCSPFSSHSARDLLPFQNTAECTFKGKIRHKRGDPFPAATPTPADICIMAVLHISCEPHMMTQTVNPWLFDSPWWWRVERWDLWISYGNKLWDKSVPHHIVQQLHYTSLHCCTVRCTQINCTAHNGWIKLKKKPTALEKKQKHFTTLHSTQFKHTWFKTFKLILVQDTTTSQPLNIKKDYTSHSPFLRAPGHVDGVRMCVCACVSCVF